MTFLYLLAALAAVLNLIVLLTYIRNQQANSYILLFLTVCVVNCSYWCLSNSGSLREAILAYNMSCLDGTFLPFFLILSMLRICQIIPSKKVIIAGSLISLSSLACVFTTGLDSVYCISAILVREGSYSYLVREYGPLRYYFLLVLIMYMIVPLGILVYAFHNKQKISYKYVIAIAVIQFITIMCFFMETILGLNVELLPFIYIIMEMIIIWIVVRTGIYDSTLNVLQAQKDNNSYGYIIFDDKKRFIGADETAMKYFSELANCHIDKPVTDAFIKSEFVDWIDGREFNSKKFIREDQYLYCTVKKIKNDRNKSKGYYVEIYDETSHHRHVEELKNMAKKAKEANRAKSTFLSSMSHEIRTPINTIMGMNEIILREATDMNILEYASDVKQASTMLLALINDILDFSKIESGKMELVEGEYNLSNMIHDLDIMIRTRAKEKKLDFYVNTSDKLPYKLFGDETKIRQIAINFLTNAVKYTDTGSVTLEVNVTDILEDRCNLIITVTDTGRGIAKENIDVLFDSFTRVDENRNKGIEGTGLGLSITKKFVELMKGDIKVESEYKKGSSFKVIIPQRIYEMEKQEETVPAEDTKNTQVTIKECRALVVDDTPMNLKVFVALLKKFPVHIDTAASGEEAFKISCENQYDIIFMDHMMPGINGIECFHMIRECEESQNVYTPIIMLTANAVEGTRELYEKEGLTDYLAKPFNPKDLEKMLAKYVK